jgi:hypothetical protein
VIDAGEIGSGVLPHSGEGNLVDKAVVGDKAHDAVAPVEPVHEAQALISLADPREWGQHDKGIADCGKVLRLDPKSILAFDLRARAWMAKEQPDKAIAGRSAGDFAVGQGLLELGDGCVGALSFSLLLQNGHNDLNQGSRFRSAVDRKPTAKQSHPLANTLQAKMPILNRFGIESDSPVPHLQANILPLLNQSDHHLLALAVLAGIGQRFLHDAVNGVLQDRGQSAKLNVAVEFDLRAAAFPLFVNQMRDGGLNPDLIDDGRANLAYQATCLRMGLAYELCGCVVSFSRLVRVTLPKPIENLKLHPRRGKVLSQPVVNLVGYGLPFVVASLEHSPK